MIALKKRNIILMLTWFVLISFTTIPLFAEASISEVDKMDDTITVQLPHDKQPGKKKQHNNPLTMAIIGLSFGCMMVASSIHWNMYMRKNIESQISNLSYFLASTCAVECHINGCTDHDPMMTAVEEIKNKRDENIKKYESDKDDAQRKYSSVEHKIMSIWG